MSSSKWQPSKGGWGIFGSDPNSNYGEDRRGITARNTSLAGNLDTALGQMSKQMTALDTFTTQEKNRAVNQYNRAGNAQARAAGKDERAGAAFNRAGDKKMMGQAKAGMQMQNAGTAAGLASAQTSMAGKAAAAKSGGAATQMAAASGMESMGQVQTQHENAMKDAYQQAAISNTQAGMAQRTSQFGAMETAFNAQQAYATAGDTRANATDALGAANDTYAQAKDTKDAQIGQATLNQANALASMAKDISSMTSAYQGATDKSYSSAELDALTEDLS